MKSYMLAHFGKPAEPAHPWDTEPVDWVQDSEPHAVECFIGGHASETVCGRSTAGSTIQTRVVYAADALPRETLCVLCQVVIEREQSEAA